MTSLTLDREVSEAIDRLMATGRYASPEEIMHEAVALLDEREAALADLDAAIMRGIQSADAGNLIPSSVAAEHLLEKYRTPAAGVR